MAPVVLTVWVDKASALYDAVGSNVISGVPGSESCLNRCFVGMCDNCQVSTWRVLLFECLQVLFGQVSLGKHVCQCCLFAGHLIFSCVQNDAHNNTYSM